MKFPFTFPISFKALLTDSLPIIQEAAPSIAAAIGGPFGFAAGYILPILAQTFSTAPHDMKTLANNIYNDPDASSKLEKLENEHGTLLSSMMEGMNTLSTAEINVKLHWQPHHGN